MSGPNASKSCRIPSAASLALASAVLVVGILSAVPCNAAELNPRDMILLDRLTWGINASSAAHLQAVGAERWLAEQLHPGADSALPDAAKAQIEAMPDVHKLPFDIANAFDQQAKSANQVADPEQKKGRAAGLSTGDERAGETGGGAQHPPCAVRTGSIARTHDLVLVQPFQRAHSTRPTSASWSAITRIARSGPMRWGISAISSPQRCTIRRC